MGTANCDNANFRCLVKRPPCCDFWHTLCGVTFVARWDRGRDINRHLTLHCRHLYVEGRVWLEIVYSALLTGNHITDVTRERVVLIYQLTRLLQINVRDILRRNILKLRTNKR